MFKYSIIDNYNFFKSEWKQKFLLQTTFIFKSEKLKGILFFDLTIVNSFEIQKINNEKRNINKPTDIIAFAFWDNPEIKTPLLGELFLNYEMVFLQSRKYKHSLERELFFLLSHGIYHLLGYDHQTEDTEKIMMQKQYKSLECIGLDKR